MRYTRQARQVHNMVVKSGNGSKVKITAPSKSNPVTGISEGADMSIEVYFVQTQYTSLDLNDSGIANGLTKLIVSPLDSNGNQVKDFVKLLQHKNAFVNYEGSNSKVSIKLAKIVMPDGETPITARVFIGG